MESTDLSIIILNYNTPDFLRQCLNSIAQTKKDSLKIETFVVDNASTDDSVSIIEKEFPWVNLIKSDKNLGFAGGNNLAVPKSRSKNVLFLNSDTLIPKEIFPEIIDFINNNERVGALTVRLELKNGKIDSDCHRGFPTPWASLTYFLGFETFFPQSSIFGRYHQFYLPLNEVHEIDSACGAFLLVKRSALEEIGYWDEKYFFYGEDIDLCFRLKEKGWKIFYYPKLTVTHYKGVSSGLRKETIKLTKADRKTRMMVAWASIEAMKIFYNKFYRKKYPSFVTSVVLIGIQIKGWARFLINYFKS